MVVDASQKPVTKDTLDALRHQISEYDACLDALGEQFTSISVKRAEYLFHVVLPQPDLLVIRPELFVIPSTALLSTHQQIASTDDYTFSCMPLDSDDVIPAFELTYGSRKMGNGIQGGLASDDIASLLAVYVADPDNESAALGILLAKEIDSTTLASIEHVNSSNATMLTTTVLAVAYMRTKNTAKLSGLDNLRDIVRSNLFRACCRATLTSRMIFDAYDLPDLRDKISEVIAWMISEDAVHTLTQGWVLKNFTSLVESLEIHGVDQEQLLSWYAGWEKHILDAAEELAKQDALFVEAIFTDNATPFKAFVAKAVEHFSSPDRNEDDWLKFISTDSGVYHHVINHMAAKGEFLVDPGQAKAAILSVLSNSVTDPENYELDASIKQNVNEVLRVIGADSRNVLGTELRNLIYSSNAKPEPVALVLAEFGMLIPDMQPANPTEIGVMLALLEYLARKTDTEGKATSFVDSKADQLSKYNYSEEFRVALASVVSKLEKSAPHLYKTFSRKRGFIGIFKSLISREAEIKSSKEQDNDVTASEAKTEDQRD